MQPITASIQRARVPPWEFSDCPGSHIRRARGATLGRESPEVQVPGGPTLRGRGRLVQGREQSLGPQRQANRCSVVTVSHQEPPLGGAHGQLWECGSAEPVRTGRRPVSAGKNRTYAPAGLLGVEAVAPRKGSILKVGKVWSPAKTRPYGKGSAYNRETGSRREGSRLAAEAVRAMTARTTQPRLSKGPLGERGRRLQERLGVVPLAAITRRGAVPVWLRASWSGPLAAATAASQPANCRRHEGWSRSPSPCTPWERGR